MEQEPREKQPTRTFKELLGEWRKEEERKLSGPQATTAPKSADDAIRKLKIIEQLEAASEQKGFADLVIPRQWEDILHRDMSWISPGWSSKGHSEILIKVDEFLYKVKSRASG